MFDTRFTVFDPEMKSEVESQFPSKKTGYRDKKSEEFWIEIFHKTYKYRSEAYEYRREQEKKKHDISRVSTKNT